MLTSAPSTLSSTSIYILYLTELKYPGNTIYDTDAARALRPIDTSRDYIYFLNCYTVPFF